ncbi:CapA family protein [Actinomadura harenae]|uniref:CapA family protein n=1 Tax=Actinomadura harenae TaxID=2483351 RepID=UPI0013154F29|nr:CapA family protein [Actinomadura harenae]
MGENAVLGVLLVGALGLAAGCGSVEARSAAPVRPPSVRGTDRFTVVGTGDFLLHSVLIEQAAADSRKGGGYDFMPMLAQLKPVIGQADLAVCHIETPLGSRSGPFSGYPVFDSPPQIVKAIRRLGYDTCSTASNHAIDQGERGVRRTLDALDRAGIGHAGTARSRREAERIDLRDVKGVKVAHFAYTYGTNGIPKPSGAPWLVNDTLKPARILADAARAKSAGAEVVVVSLHWGEEYRHGPTGEQRRLARRLLHSDDIDLILGDHVHVVQPFERINGKWVAYGMGNQVANPSANIGATHEGLVARFTFSRDVRGRWRARPSFVPTFVRPGPPIRLRTLTANSSAQGVVDDTKRVVRSLGYDVPIAPDDVIRPPSAGPQALRNGEPSQVTSLSKR